MLLTSLPTVLADTFVPNQTRGGPAVKADTLTLKALFQKDVRYAIPTFQRPYVWNQEDQWEPLWDDVRNTAERYLDHLAEATGDNAVAVAEERTGRHFLGAVVLQQRPTASAEIETRYVIDGQQRMTTLQLVLDAAQEVLERAGHDVEARRMTRLVINQDADGDDVFKLWPTLLDREPFRLAMTNELSPDGFADSRIVQAHDFFRLQIEEWLGSANPDRRAQLVHGLETALVGLLEIVVIDLGTNDDSFVIFETLNARGTPLLASDLVKNYLLQQSTASGANADSVYETYWKQLEDAWWREDVRQGRIVRPRVDQFLNYWLTMRTCEEVQAGEVFPAFRSYAADGRGIQDVATDIARTSVSFRGLNEFPPFSPEGSFMYRWRIIEAGVTTPLLLWTFSQTDAQLAPERRRRFLRALESYLVRRMVCRATTKDYNRLFLDALQEVQSNGSRADDALIDFLAGQSSESRVWATDDQVTTALLEYPLYQLLTRGRLRMVLEALEDSLRSPKSEAAHVERGRLTIEHVLPRGWREHWPLPETDDPVAAAQARERILHSIGNLTLVNQKLNTGMSNDPWAKKQKTLFDHTVLHLNKELLGGWANGEFDESTIRARGAILADRAISIWPSAASI